MKRVTPFPALFGLLCGTLLAACGDGGASSVSSGWYTPSATALFDKGDQGVMYLQLSGRSTVTGTARFAGGAQQFDQYRATI